jgi:glycosyltransferase involved in cell wall biosynthesis
VYWHSDRFKKVVGGPLKVYELATNLTRLHHRVLLFIPKIGFPEQQTTARVVAVPFIDLPIVRFLSFQLFAVLIALRFIIKNGRPDVIYVRIMWSFIPMLLGKVFHIPVMLEVNDSPHRSYEHIQSGFKRRLVHLIDRISYRLSKHILPVTFGIARDLELIENISPDRMTVLPSGANTDLSRPLDKSYCCDELGLDPNNKYVGFIGTFYHYQGIDVLIDSASLIIKKYPDVIFLLVGDGPMRPIWQKRITTLGLDPYFILTGFVPYENVPLYSGASDVCISPYLREAAQFSPVKVFDYLACGKPVVISDVADVRIIFHESNAVLFIEPENPTELANAINTLLDSPKKRKIMGKKGRNFIVSRYDRKNIAKQVEQITAMLCNQNISCNKNDVTQHNSSC